MTNDEKSQKDITWKQNWKKLYQFEFREEPNWLSPSSVK